MNLDKAKQALKRYFGYDQFRPLQAEIIRAIFAGKDALVLMPTGGGKSVCFQIPAVTMPGTCVVVSPLISLMKDQVEGLRANGIQAAFLNSAIDSREQLKVEESFYAGALNLLYVSPEKLVSGNFVSILKRGKINLFAIDEAHCISAWGHDFRPEYTQMGMLKQHFPQVPVIALTATADKLTRKDIVDQLKLEEPGIFIASFDRPNLSLEVRPGQQRLGQIQEFVQKHPKQAGIIYCLSRKTAEDVAAKLAQQGLKAEAYHAGLSPDRRSKIQDNFINDNIHIICATVAFGMGIDKSNVRWVIHYNLPKNLEGYYQEIGRAGRDGAKADTLLFYSFADVSMLRDIIQNGENAAQNEIQLVKLERMQQYAESLACRRRILLAYFSENLSKNCGNCDICRNPPQYIDGTQIAQKALSAVYRVNEQVPMGMLIDVLRGSGRKEIRQLGYDTIKTYGAGRDLSQWDWQQYLMQLVNLGYLEIAYDANSVLRLTAASHEVLFKSRTVQLVKPSSYKERQEEEKAAAKTKPKTLAKQERLRDELFEQLRQVRKEIAQQEGIPPYLIFSDATLEEMAFKKPLSETALLGVSGVGEKKLAQFGQQFLEAILEFVGSTSPKEKNLTYKLSLELLKKGLSLEAIAEKRGIETSTVLAHLAYLYETGEEVPLFQFVSKVEIQQILKARGYLENPSSLKTLYDYFDGKMSYDKIKLAMAWGRKNGG
ncbi:DNA helicase RecQ [Haliscomenobacter hydrossis]|uniref:DNA helicase RecQ n=1 Tax=Haliscomenobacter hydrossis (strain ATCC 27775 / DSM 1100 / LMG 10767 / O) TaxID=760192 RepID=F4L1G9_HALH1|nr:DNA helicase RecQ [Haliscomenobacter hydrossis]AEE53866.1 ATP-dependent DNA helicase RecQ [Haliscomenobacter hydrossis DSM 1100]